MTRVAICEDDAALRSVLRRALESDGHEVVATATGAELLRAVGAQPAHLVVLDVGLPDADGRDVCAALRAGSEVPVLMLTALDGMHHKVAGFEAGADDYLTKPFDVPELLVRVRALLRRTPTAVEVSDGIVLDPAGHRVSLAGRATALTPTEFRLLARLVRDPGQAVRRHQLVAAGWPHGAAVSDNTLDSYLRRLRSKLDEIGAGERIQTRRGIGYEWT